jgi:hypothetical protein
MYPMNLRIIKYSVLSLLIIVMAPLAHAADVITDKSIGMDLARDIANETILACRKDGYHVSVVVVDRFGLMRAALRDEACAQRALENLIDRIEFSIVD